MQKKKKKKKKKTNLKEAWIDQICNKNQILQTSSFLDKNSLEYGITCGKNIDSQLRP